MAMKLTDWVAVYIVLKVYTYNIAAVQHAR